MLIGYPSQSSIAPELGPYNTLMCRPGKIASFPLNQAISKKSLVVAMDYYSYAKTSGVEKQTIFGVRDATANKYSLRFHHNLDLDRLNMRSTPLSANPPMSEYTIWSNSVYNQVVFSKGNFNAISNN